MDQRTQSQVTATALVRAAQEGRDGSFAELVRIYQDRAVAYAASILKDHHLAEDAAQEAFLEVYRGLRALREPAAFEAWFRMIVFKQCDRITRKRRLLLEALDSGVQAPPSLRSPWLELESQDAATTVWRAIEVLSSTERAVVLLYYMGGHEQSSVATFLGITENTVKTRLYSARRRLRTSLTQLMQTSFSAVRPSRNSRFSRSVMSAALRLQLFYVDHNGERRGAGTTVGRREPPVPYSALWFVEPRQRLTTGEWDKLLALMVENQTPGLAGASQITDENLRRISRCVHLRYLDLSDCGAVTDEGLQQLAELPNLEYLILNGTRITDGGLRVLRRLSRLKTVDLCHQQFVTDEGIANITGCEQLERLNLMGTRTGDGSIRALHGKMRLRHLFAGTCTTDEGLADLKYIPLFTTGAVGSDYALSLLDFQYHPTYLWLNLKSSFTNAGLRRLCMLHGLTGLNLFGSSGNSAFDDTHSKITPAGLQNVVELPALVWMGCCARLCNDEAMKSFASMPRLRFLMCQDTVAGDEGFSALSRSQTLEFVWGRHCHNLTGRGLSSMQEMPALRGLAVSCRNVDDDSLATLPAIRTLRELMPIDVADSGFRHVGHCRELEFLYCMYCQQTTDISTRHISSLRLKSYQAWNTQITDESLGMLTQMKSLEHLRFYRCPNITDMGIARLTSLSRLSQLDLEGLNRVSEDIPLIFRSDISVNYEAVKA